MNSAEEYEQNIKWLREAVPPDDIYDFAYNNYLACEFFIAKWAQHVDLNEQYHLDNVAKLWLKNVIGFRIVMQEKAKVLLDMEENENYPDG